MNPLAVLFGIPAVVFFLKAIKWDKGHYWQNLLMVVLTVLYGSLCVVSAVLHWSVNGGGLK